MPNHVSGVYQAALLLLASLGTPINEFIGTSISPAITYRHDIAPILRQRCVTCHGRDGISSNNLDLRTYRTLLLGGNIGGDIVVGKPDSSVLVHFVEGRRGREHRMPLHRRPLSPAQIRLIRRWIAEGASP